MNVFKDWKRNLTLMVLLLPLAVLAACGDDGAVPTAVPRAEIPEGVDAQIQLPPEETAVATAVIVAAEPGELAPLPPLGNETAAAGGVGVVSTSGQVEGGGADTALSMIVTDPFSETTFTLNTDLPGNAEEATVFRHNQSGTVDLAQAQNLAARFGFNGDLYLEKYPDPSELEPGLAEFSRPVIYYAFTGPTTFSIDAWSGNYQDEEALYDFENTVDYATASQVAESFLQERGLLDFPYVIQPGFGSDIFVMRQIDGRVSNQPEIAVGVSQDGRVSYVSYQVMQNLENLGTYPLIPATEAWTKLQAGIGSNSIPYIINPPESGEEAVAPAPVIGDFQSWQRDYQPSELVQLYGWPTVYLPASGSGTARVQLFPFLLAGEAETLNQIAENVGLQVTVEGVVGDDGRSVTVNNWAQVEEQEPISTQGVIRRDGERVLLEAVDGQTYILPSVPADVPDGIEAYVFAWSSQQTGEAFPLLQWESINKVVDADEGETAVTEPLPVESVDEPFGFDNVSVDGVELAYYVTYLFSTDAQTEQVSEQVTILLQPVWKFTGTADSGEIIEFFVQAVSEEYIQ